MIGLPIASGLDLDCESGVDGSFARLSLALLALVHPRTCVDVSAVIARVKVRGPS